jgi:transcriptional regulator with XRE-family HTH domain
MSRIIFVAVAMNRTLEGRKLRRAAQAAGLSFQQLADALGVSRPTMYAYAAGRLRLDERRLAKLASLLDVVPEALERDADRDAKPGIVDYVRALMQGPAPESAVQVGLEALAREDLAGAERAHLGKLVGDALMLQGAYVRAAEQLEGARRAFLGIAQAEAAGGCAQSLGYCYINLGALQEARIAFESAHEEYGEESRWKPDVSLAALSEREGRFDEAIERLDRLERADLPPLARLYVKGNRASLWAALGRWKDALLVNAEAYSDARRLGVRDQLVEAMLLEASGRLRTGEIEESALWLIRGQDAARAAGDQARLVLGEVLKARLYLALGELKRARRQAAEALDAAVAGRFRRSEMGARLLMAELAAARGDFEQAAETAQQAETFARTERYEGFAAEARVLKLHMRLASQEWSSADPDLQETVKQLGESPYGEPLAAALAVSARLHAQSDPARAASDATAALDVAQRAGSWSAARLAAEVLERVGDGREQARARGVLNAGRTEVRVPVEEEDALQCYTIQWEGADETR